MNAPLYQFSEILKSVTTVWSTDVAFISLLTLAGGLVLMSVQNIPFSFCVKHICLCFLQLKGTNQWGQIFCCWKDKSSWMTSRSVICKIKICFPKYIQRHPQSLHPIEIPPSNLHCSNHSADFTSLNNTRILSFTISAAFQTYPLLLESLKRGYYGNYSYWNFSHHKGESFHAISLLNNMQFLC